MNGRSGSSVVLTGTTAVKTVRGPWEPQYMARFPDVFVRVVSTATVADSEDVEYSTVEGVGATYEDLTDALPKAAALLPRLWTHPAPHPFADWKPALYQHLRDVVHREQLQLRTDDVRFLVKQADHHQLKTQRCIHGDPTLANLVYDARLPFGRWRWIDPLTRPFIPGDPLVDLGKLFQSCLGYERVLAGLEPERDDALMEGLAQQLGLCEYHGLVWCAIHLVRLIPYQRANDKPIFAEMLHRLIDELKSTGEDGQRHSPRLNRRQRS